MIVTVYQTTDGRTFDTLIEAQTHQSLLEVKRQQAEEAQKKKLEEERLKTEVLVEVRELLSKAKILLDQEALRYEDNCNNFSSEIEAFLNKEGDYADDTYSSYYDSNCY